MKFESAINICQSNCGILHLSPLHLCKDMHSFDAATMPGCNFSILMGILCDYPQNRSSKIAVPYYAVSYRAAPDVFPRLALSYHALPYHALPCPAVPCRTLPCYAMSCPAMPCSALPCPAVPCPSVPCPARCL